MDTETRKVVLTLVLCTTAGFCDALTYTSANGLFSAHVTGNFILFATNLVNTTGHDPWIKLLTFPVFIVSVMAGGWIGSKSANKNLLLLIEALMLSITGAAAILAQAKGLISVNAVVYFIAMMMVSAMGIQNAYGKLFSSATFGPTTMMTGNVTQWSLDLKNIGLSHDKKPLTVTSFKKTSLIIAGFLVGCVAGALAGKLGGLGTAIFPGAAMITCYRLTGNKEDNDLNID